MYHFKSSFALAVGCLLVTLWGVVALFIDSVSFSVCGFSGSAEVWRGLGPNPFHQEACLYSLKQSFARVSEFW